MGVDISVGNSGSRDYVSEKLGSSISILGWKDRIREKLAQMKVSVSEFDLILGYSGDYKVEDLHRLLKQLNDIKKLDIEDNDTIIGFSIKDKKLEHQGTLIIKSEDPIIDKFIRVCKLAIERKQPIKVSF